MKKGDRLTACFPVCWEKTNEAEYAGPKTPQWQLSRLLSLSLLHIAGELSTNFHYGSR